MRPDPNLHAGMGAWSDALPAWARTILVGVEAAVPQFALLDTAGQAAVAAIMDLPDQHDRAILALTEEASKEIQIALALDAVGSSMSPGLRDSFEQWKAHVQAAIDANEQATRIVLDAIGVLRVGGVVIPGLDTVASALTTITGPGMGAVALIPALAVVLIVLGIGAITAAAVVSWYKVSQDHLLASQAMQAQFAENHQAIVQGRPIPYPNPTAPPPGDSTSKAVSGAIAIAGIGVVGWLAIQFMQSRRKTA